MAKAGALVKGTEAAKGKMNISRKQMTIRNIFKQRNKIRFDLAIQRNSVWKETAAVPQKTKLIDSILNNFPIPQVFVLASDDGIMWMADGRQRWGTVFEFLDNKFPLAKGTAPVSSEGANGELVMHDVEGKFFKDLDKEMQNQIYDYEMDVREIRNATPAQVEELFIRLNNGTPLSKIELTRATIGSENMEEVNKLAEFRFYRDLAFISEGSRNRFVDQELILQTLMLVMGRETGISSKEINEFTQAVKKSGIPADAIKVMEGTAQYIADGLEHLITIKDGKPDMGLINKMLKKIHIPMLVVTADEAIKQEIEPEVFGEWVKSFLHTRYTPGSGAYGKHCIAGSAKKENVMGRLKVMKNDFNTKIDGIKAEWEANAGVRAEAKRLAEEQEAARLAAEEEAKRQQEEQGENPSNEPNGEESGDSSSPSNTNDGEPSGDSGSAPEEQSA